MSDFQKDYEAIRGGALGFHRQNRGLFAVSGGEAVQFLNGLITNDVETLEDGAQMLAAFPTVKGRVFAIVRVMRRGESYLFETEEATREKVYENLTRFTFAGDFHLDDKSGNYSYYSIYGETNGLDINSQEFIKFNNDYFVSNESVGEFEESLSDAVEISDELYEILRIENGIPKYGIDMDEETVVPEVNVDGMISYDKGCYIGQEVIARIHFRGKPAKQLRGLVFEEMSGPSAEKDVLTGAELRSPDGKNAGKVTSIAVSPKLGKTIALGYVRNAFLESGTELSVGNKNARVIELPFIS
ncbi:MAG: folate-binding protein YgfZ [Pyrinomonadaceae bacterium]|nr:folate-binding protein YgfZ [Pyrinomonadaceae bacterium]